MAILDIVKDIEAIMNSKVIYVISAGSEPFNNALESSDRDYRVFVMEGDHSPIHYDDDNIDVWISNLTAMRITYPFYHICSLDGAEQCVYYNNEYIKDYLNLNQNDLVTEFSVVVFNLLSEKVKELYELGEEKYESNFRQYSSRMRDSVLSSIMLSNFMNGLPISELSTEQKQMLRDIRGKDTVKLSYQESINKLNTIFNQDLIDYYSSLNPGKRKTRELLKIINRTVG